MTAVMLYQAGIAQLVEHQPSKLRVAGSRPVSRSIFNLFGARVAQLVEHFHGKEGVSSSNLLVGSIVVFFFYFFPPQCRLRRYVW